MLALTPSRLARLPLSSAVFLVLVALPPGPAAAQHLDDQMNNEHNAMLDLVPTASATHTAQASGNWSSPSTWNTSSVPGNGARVVIPSGVTVTYDVSSAATIQWIRVDGKLTFSRSASTALTVDTIVVPPSGDYEQGTASSPIPAQYTSIVTFSDGGSINDTLRIGRGLLTHGRVAICGATVTPFIKANGAIATGASSVTLQSTPSNWKSGDTVVVTATRLRYLYPGGRIASSLDPDDEIRTLSSVSGSTVTFSASIPRERKVEFGQFGLYPVIANLDRNVIYRSANTSTTAGRRGHVIFMHNQSVDVRYAAFLDLGRTRKDVDVTDSATNANPPGSNPRGKYALHFHRAGKDSINGQAGFVKGCVVRNPTSWGFVNHDSHVNMEDNIAFNAFGAAFITENGAELGSFKRNLASTCIGRGFIKDGTANHDLARSGVGFWFQGGNIIVENNIATGCSSGYSYFQRTGVDLGQSQHVLAQNLYHPDWSGGELYVEASDTAISRFYGNIGMANYQGIFNVDTEINGKNPTETVIDSYADLNSHGGHGLRFEYYRNFTFRNLRVVRDSSLPSDSQYSGTFAINANHLVDHIFPWETRSADRHDNVYIRGYHGGVDNDDGDLGVGAGSPERIAKHEVLNDSVDFVGPGAKFANTGTLLGQPLVKYYGSADVVPLPTFSPAAGVYNNAQSVTISAPGATIYYVLGNPGYQNPSVESRLKSGTWTQYTGGSISIPDDRVLIAIAYKNGQKSRPRRGLYTIDPNATPTTAGGSTGGSSTGGSSTGGSSTGGSSTGGSSTGSSGGSSLPSPWQSADIGSVGSAGSSSHSSGAFTLEGSGADIWGTADAFHFVHQTLNGDGEIRARIASLENTDAWAKAGVMIRESLQADSKHAFMALTSANGLAFQRRSATAGDSQHTGAGAASAPVWLRLVRSGSTVTASSSSDGSSWTQAGSVTLAMANSVRVGLAVTSHNNSTLCTATFNNVTVVTGSSSTTGGATTGGATTGGSSSGGSSTSGGTGSGLAAEYFNNATLSGTAALVRTDATVDFNWGSASPGSGIGTDNFSVRWSGQVEAPVSGTYTFQTESDDGIRLWVNGQQVINNWTDHGPTVDNSSGVSLTAGFRYDIRLEYYEKGGGAVARLRWITPGSSTAAAIPSNRLFPATPSGGSTGGSTPTTLTLTPTDDRDTQSDNASGTNPTFNASQWNHIYLRFNLATVSGTVSSAKLRLYKEPASSGLPMNVSRVSSDAWTQATAPASLPALGSVLTDITVPDASGYVEFDLTAEVAAQASGDDVVSFGVRTGLGSWTSFQSKEGANTPQLIVISN